MELVTPPSQKANPTAWVILLICCAVISLIFLGLQFGGRGSQQPAPVAVDAVPQSAPAEPAAQTAPGPAGQEQERMLVTAPEPSAPAPAPAAAPAVRPAQAAARQSPAPAAAAWKPAKHLKVTRHLWGAPSRTAAVLPAQVNSRPAEPAAREAPEDAQQPQAGAAATAPVASARYGVTTREQIMGQAAGPVYNLKGRGLKSGARAPSRVPGSVSKAQEQGEESQDGAEAAPEER